MDENIIQCIYKSCDENNTNSVPVSTLIDFIKPYMPNNVNELVDLKSKLDPNNSNPDVGPAAFQQAMSDWIANIQADEGNNSLSEFPNNLNQSINSSSSQMSSYHSKFNNTVNEIRSEDQMDRLKYQLNKAVTDLNLVRQQLTASEEQNEALLIELNMRRKTENMERHHSDSRNASMCQNEEITEEVNEISKKCELLERMLSSSDKQQEKFLAQISQLENENALLKNRIQSFERTKRESRRSLTEMRDSIDVKESEISTLMEIIDNLKCELEEKTEVVNFYANEHKLLKQRNHELETLFRARRDSFNTPKLLNQIANPVTPDLCSPIPRRFSTSSPVHNSSVENLNLNNSDLICNSVGVVSALRSPHKTLKEELAEISYDKLNGSSGEPDRLNRDAKLQEDIKNNLWENIKQLNSDRETLLDYKKEYFGLLKENERKKQRLEDLSNELEYLKQMVLEQKGTREIVRYLNLNLEDLEKQLLKQKLLSMRSQIKLKRLHGTLAKTVKRRSTNQSSQTDGLDWNVNVPISGQEGKCTNYAKLELKLDRLLERKEKLEHELAKEKAINVRLTMKSEDKSSENIRISYDLKTLRAKLLKEEKLSKRLALEKSDLERRSETLTAENSDLVAENDRLKEEIAICMTGNRRLEENLRDCLKNLALEVAAANQLRMEIKFLVNAQCQTRGKVQEEHLLVLRLRREFADLRKQLLGNCLERDAETRTLKKLVEVGDGRYFLYSCNEQLRKALRYVDDCRKWNDGLINNLPDQQQPLYNDESFLDPGNQMIILNNNVATVASLLQDLCNTQMGSSDGNMNGQGIRERSEILDNSLISNNSERCDEDITNYNINSDESFISCSSELSFSEEVPEIRLFEYGDSFLDGLQMEQFDFSHLSKKEMEEKFATLALLMTVDVKTLHRRNINEQDNFRRSTANFFTRLNYTIHLLDKAECHPNNERTCKMVHAGLKQLKDVTREMLANAVKCTVLTYEKKVAKCWKLMVNYVAIMSQENNQVRDCEQILEVEPPAVCHQATITDDFLPPAHFGWGSSNLKFWIYTGFLSLIFMVIAFIIYIDQMCPKTGKRTCPIAWIGNLVVKKTHLSEL